MKVYSPSIIEELIVSGAAEVSGTLTTNNILPSTTDQFDLGSTDKRFKDLYLSGSTIFLGNVKLTESDEGTLQVINANEEIIVVGEVDTEIIDGRLQSLETESGSIRTALNNYTSSADNRLGSLEVESGSIRTTFNNYTSSADNRLGSLEVESGSIRTTFNSFTSSLSNVDNTADVDKPLSTAQKTYVDEVAQGLKARTAARVLVDSNLDATYDNGTAGSGSFLEANSNGVFPTTDGIDTAELNVVGVRMLIAGQTNKAHNGLYVVQTAGDSETPWKIRRCIECDSSEEIPGSFVFIKAGTLYGNTGWVLLVDNPATFTIGTDDINPTQFSGAGSFLAGAGLGLDGNVFSLDTGSVHFNTGVKDKLSLDGVVSGSGQVAINSTDGTLNVNKGGTGQTSYVNGELLIGNSTGNTLTKATLTGTSNQITVTNGGGSITLSTPQNLDTSSNFRVSSLGIGADASATAGEITIAGQIRLPPTTLGTTGTINIDFAGAAYRTQAALTGNITYTASNYAAGRTVTIRVINGGTQRTLTFPTNWVFVCTKPANIAANKRGILTVTSFGTTEADCIAAWAVQP